MLIAAHNTQSKKANIGEKRRGIYLLKNPLSIEKEMIKNKLFL